MAALIVKRRTTGSFLTCVVILVLTLSVNALLSGCMTTLGYVPEYIKPRNMSDKKTLIPTYREVKEWAIDVADGYDSRAIINRYAQDWGAVLAGAAAGALVGLAALHPHAHLSAITGIPIGATFLGGVAAVYQNEKKAYVYMAGRDYVKKLIDLGNERVILYFREIGDQAAGEVDASNLAVTLAQNNLNKAQDVEKLQSDEAKTASDKVKSATTDNQKQVFEKSARALQDLSNQAKQDASDAHVALSSAQNRQKAAKALQDRLKYQFSELDKQEPKPTYLDKVKYLEAPENQSDFYSAEAICLQMDVNDALHKVSEHILALDPNDTAARLAAVKAPASDTKTNTSGTKPATTKPLAGNRLRRVMEAILRRHRVLSLL